MELTKEKYTVGQATLRKVLDVLAANRTASSDDDEYNNDDVIEAQDDLECELEKQEG